MKFYYLFKRIYIIFLCFLRSIHISNRYKIVSLPMDILMKNKVSQEAVLRSNDSEELKNTVFEVASRANSHLEKVC